jgi:hypothetical protein
MPKKSRLFGFKFEFIIWISRPSNSDQFIICCFETLDPRFCPKGSLPKKTGNSLVFYQRGGGASPPLLEFGRFPVSSEQSKQCSQIIGLFHVSDQDCYQRKKDLGQSARIFKNKMSSFFDSDWQKGWVSKQISVFVKIRLAYLWLQGTQSLKFVCLTP